MTHGIVEHLRTGDRALAVGDESVLVCPEHEEETDQSGHHNVGLHCDVKAGKVESIHVIDIRVPQLKLPQFHYFIKLILFHLYFLPRPTLEPRHNSIDDMPYIDELQNRRNHIIGNRQVKYLIDQTLFIEYILLYV